MNYENAVERYKDYPRPFLDEFIEHVKSHWPIFGVVWGDGIMIQAVEIAEQLKNLTKEKQHD